VGNFFPVLKLRALKMGHFGPFPLDKRVNHRIIGRLFAVFGRTLPKLRWSKVMQAETDLVDSLVRKHGAKKEALIPILQDIQSDLNWLPEEVLRAVADKLAVPLRDVYGVATFYRTLSLRPRGKHIVTVCLGTACHVRGGQRIMDQISETLGIAPGETTRDMNFTLETVNCLGCCAIGPIVVVDGEYYGEMTSRKVGSVLEKYQVTSGE
jgi:NADH:ubiquinone oxidoreductase subunit E